jgi:hypothetical protein
MILSQLPITSYKRDGLSWEGYNLIVFYYCLSATEISTCRRSLISGGVTVTRKILLIHIRHGGIRNYFATGFYLSILFYKKISLVKISLNELWQSPQNEPNFFKDMPFDFPYVRSDKIFWNSKLWSTKCER